MIPESAFWKASSVWHKTWEWPAHRLSATNKTSFPCLCPVFVHAQCAQTDHTVTAALDKAPRWRTGHNSTAAGGASSEVKMSSALGDFNLPRCCRSTGSLASAQSNLQCNPRPDCFPSTAICTRCLSRLAAEKSAGVVKEARLCHLVPSGAVLWNAGCQKL